MIVRLATDVTNLIPRPGARDATLMNGAEELIARVRNGNDEAFWLLFERHVRTIFRFVYAMTGEFDVAEELIQEAFLGAYWNIGSLRDDSKSSPGFTPSLAT
jgi:RNA polymerase sigma-70 factor, ECF subfamily